ncbi:MAG: copper transporter [Actinomycetota bacterium]|nr:copper transporter [Actinomycetota bacterium]
MLDFKYHISSLIAVFLALAVGILLGLVIVDKGIIAKQQQTLIDSVQTDIKQVQEENQAIKLDFEDSVKVERALLPLAVEGRLSGRNLVFISSKKYPDGLIDTLKKAATLAGARGSFLTVQPDLGLSTKSNFAALSAILGEGLSAEELKMIVTQRLAGELSSVTDRALFNKLTSLKIIRSDSKVFLPGSDFIFVGSDMEDFNPKAFDLPLIEELKLRTERVVAVETEDIKNSSIPLYQESSISTVDNIDEVSGLISLTYSLSGSPGHYGSKETSERLLPKEMTD